MENFINLLKELDKSNKCLSEDIQFKLMEIKEELLKANNHFASETAEAMKEQKVYRVEKLQKLYKKNLDLIEEIEKTLDFDKKNTKNKYEEMFKELTEGEIKRDPFPTIDREIFDNDPTLPKFKTSYSFIAKGTFNNQTKTTKSFLDNIVEKSFNNKNLT